MERETIERLAMDAAVGELNEDARTLLNAYLVEHPDMRDWAQQMDAACRQVHKAFCTGTRRNDDVPIVSIHPRPSIRWAVAGRWAAVVMIAVLAGMQIGRRPESVPNERLTGVTTGTARSESSRSWQDILREPGNGFWESKAAAVRQAVPRRTSAPQPSLWEAFGQLQKGHNHEQSRQ
jgi:hypothetical protein